ncbi:hypothetical protein [Dactylosporangium sp. NPDC049140]|uniref:hypothetical protein n=1 Tax=Dactylosporangium sp. NPDC049140 TaxID=3155647 RepID=UPI00341055D2
MSAALPGRPGAGDGTGAALPDRHPEAGDGPGAAQAGRRPEAGESMNTALPRRYRRLLLAYPAAYRRSHGTEILTTLMDGAGPGRQRPTAGEVHDILVGGLRQRFRLPAGRVMVLAALASALIAGGLGAGLGSLAGWAVAEDPGDAVVAELVTLAAGAPAEHYVTRQPEAFGLNAQAITSARTAGPPSLAAARARLEAAGWRVTPTGYDDTVLAARGGIQATVSVDGYGSVAVIATGVAPAVAGPLTAAGAVLGLVAGWLLAAWVGRRLRRAAFWWRVAVGELALLAALTLAWPTLGAWAYVTLPESRAHLFYAYAAYEVDRPLGLLTVAGLALAALAVGLSAVIQKQARVATLP